MASYCGQMKNHIFLLVLLILSNQHWQAEAQSARRPLVNNRNRIPEKQAIFKDSFYEDSNFVVRIRATHNKTTSFICNGVLMEEQLVLSELTCIRYQQMANIDAKYLEVIAGEANSEKVFLVDQIYINKPDPRDPSTELALLHLSSPLKVDTECRHLIRPEKNHSIEFGTLVRVIGYTGLAELKESRSRVAKKLQEKDRLICTSPTDLGESAGSYLLMGAPLVHMVDCRQYQLIGILTKVETSEGPGLRKQQDCYVMVSTAIKWYEQVRQLTILNAKNDAASSPYVVTVAVEPEL